MTTEYNLQSRNSRLGLPRGKLAYCYVIIVAGCINCDKFKITAPVKLIGPGAAFSGRLIPFCLIGPHVCHFIIQTVGFAASPRRLIARCAPSAPPMRTSYVSDVTPQIHSCDCQLSARLNVRRQATLCRHDAEMA